MLTPEQIKTNREQYINILKSIKREFNIDELVKYLDDNSFFTAPASTQYHCSFEGGLCAHSLEVYNNLVNITSTVCGRYDKVKDDDTIKIIALFHDIAKMNLYEESALNEKVYCDNGTSVDAKGRFNWISRVIYKVKSSDLRDVYGDRCFTAYFIISRFIPLTDLEIIILVNQYSAFDTSGCSNKELSVLLGKYPLISLLHSADILSTYITELKYNSEQSDEQSN